MSAIIEPGAGILFMKVGTHAQEDLTEIIKRKTREIEETGYGMWGYGGNTCHPRSMVQPFAEMFQERGRTIHLVMQEVKSNHFAEPLRAEQFSVDGIKWKDIPSTINVRGSRYALVIKSLHREELQLPLTRTMVPVGPSTGRIGARYLRGQVDKACLEVLEHAEKVNEEEQPTEVAINLIAELTEPYAVFLKTKG